MINKTTLIVSITLIVILYLILEGRKEFLNERTNQEGFGVVTYLKTGVNSTVNKLCSTVGNMTPRQLSTVSQLSNFCLKTIVK